MYFSGWIILVALSLWISLTAFLWGLQSGQFSDQERARYLPLRDLPPRPSVQDPVRRPMEVYCLLFISLLVILGLAGSVILSFSRSFL